MVRSPNPGTQTFRGERRTIITATANIKTEAGRIYRIIVVTGIGAIDVYDDPAANNLNVYSRAATAVGDTYELDCPLSFGIRIVMAGAGTLVIVWT